jgi:hypothetical protein
MKTSVASTWQSTRSLAKLGQLTIGMLPYGVKRDVKKEEEDFKLSQIFKKFVGKKILKFFIGKKEITEEIMLIKYVSGAYPVDKELSQNVYVCVCVCHVAWPVTK